MLQKDLGKKKHLDWCLETTWGEGRLLARRGMVYTTVSRSLSAGIVPPPYRAASHNGCLTWDGGGLGLGGASSCPLLSPAQWWLQVPICFLFSSISCPFLFSWLLLPLWCARISDGERGCDCCQGRALASWREAEGQSLKRQEIFCLPQENTTRKKVLKPPEVARAWEETQIPISEEIISSNDGKGIRKEELQAGVKTMTKDVGESDEV